MRWIALIALAAGLVYGFDHGGRDTLDDVARAGAAVVRDLERGMLASRGLD